MGDMGGVWHSQQAPWCGSVRRGSCSFVSFTEVPSHCQCDHRDGDLTYRDFNCEQQLTECIHCQDHWQLHATLWW